MKTPALLVLAGVMVIVGTTLALVGVLGDLPYWGRPAMFLGGLMLSAGGGAVFRKAMGA